MAVNGVGNQSFLENTSGNYNKKSKSQGSFYENFVNNLGDKAASNEKGLIRKSNSQLENRKTSDVNYRFNSVSAKIALTKSGQVNLGAVIECGVRNISCAESDHVKVCLLQGYTLKAQVEVSEHKVYIEKKNEDGTIYGYEVDPLKLEKTTENPVERMALEAWRMVKDTMAGENVFEEIMVEEMGKDKKDMLGEEREKQTNKGKIEEDKEELEELSWDEAMLKFYHFIENRIKNGPPKIQIGAAEFSVEEWNDFIETIEDENKSEKIVKLNKD